MNRMDRPGVCFGLDTFNFWFCFQLEIKLEKMWRKWKAKMKIHSNYMLKSKWHEIIDVSKTNFSGISICALFLKKFVQLPSFFSAHSARFLLAPPSRPSTAFRLVFLWWIIAEILCFLSPFLFTQWKFCVFFILFPYFTSPIHLPVFFCLSVRGIVSRIDPIDFRYVSLQKCIGGNLRKFWLAWWMIKLTG